MRSFQKRGFEIFEEIFDEQECKAILSDLHPSVRMNAPGYRSLLGGRFVESIAWDARLIKMAEGLLSGTAVPYKAILFDKSHNANWLVPWHQDRVLPIRNRFVDPEWGPWTAKGGVNFAHAPTWAMNRIVAFRIHLDNSEAHNGPLRVIPGSHLHGVLDQREVVELSKKSDFEICTVRKGGVLAMRPLLIHASSKSTSQMPRRVLHIEYADSLRLADGIELSLS